jgi:acetyltransferase-like isoleucine patch superfamily enzyme
MISQFIRFLLKSGFDKVLIPLRFELDRRIAELQTVGPTTSSKLRFFAQGEGTVTICGPSESFQIAPTSHLKSGTYINSAGGVKIGQYFHPGKCLTIYSANHDYDHGDAIPYDERDILKPVVIEDFVWCGANVIILPGVTIGEGAVIGAGAVVTKSIPPMVVAAGNPARVIKYRNKEHFEKLKAEGKFC